MQCLLVCLYFPSKFTVLLRVSLPDQIDENLKLTLQKDLTAMAPGLIIQVRYEHGPPTERLGLRRCLMFWRRQFDF